ncbi:MAG: hypothetical protein LBE58_17235, partial [Comamonas sp.]|nr:hypothetical protein [Comamonas sp.]
MYRDLPLPCSPSRRSAAPAAAQRRQPVIALACSLACAGSLALLTLPGPVHAQPAAAQTAMAATQSL